jgi:isorenieratene synthase
MLTPRDILAIPSVLGSLLIATGVDPLREGRSLQGRTLADFCKGWPPRITAFVASLARSGLSAHPEEVPLAGFIAFLRFYTLLRRDSQKFHYLAADPETALIGPLVRKIQELGGEVRQGCRVERLERWNETGWQVCSDKGEIFQTPQLIMATDAPATRQLLSNSPATQEIAANMSWPQGLETAVARFWFSAAPQKRSAEAGIVSGDFAIDNFFWLHRIQDIFADWHAATGGSAIEAHIYGQENLALDDQTLLARAQSDLSRIFPDLKDKIIHATLQRNSPSHTLFGVGSLAQHIGVNTPWPGLLCCGDWVRHPLPALFLERATATGIVAANAVLESNGKPPFPLQKYDKPEFLSRVMGGWMGSMRGTKRIRGLRTE